MCDLAADWSVWMATAHAMAKVTGERTALFVTNGHYRIVRVTDARWLHRKGVLTAMLAHDAAVRGYRRHIDRGIEQLAEMANQ